VRGAPPALFLFAHVQLLSDCGEALWVFPGAAGEGGPGGRADGRARPRAEGEEPDPKLVGLLARDEAARRITQVYCLERLAAGDTATARLMLSALAQARRPTRARARAAAAPPGAARC